MAADTCRPGRVRCGWAGAFGGQSPALHCPHADPWGSPRAFCPSYARAYARARGEDGFPSQCGGLRASGGPFHPILTEWKNGALLRFWRARCGDVAPLPPPTPTCPRGGPKNWAGTATNAERDPSRGQPAQAQRCDGGIPPGSFRGRTHQRGGSPPPCGAKIAVGVPPRTGAFALLHPAAKLRGKRPRSPGRDAPPAFGVGCAPRTPAFAPGRALAVDVGAPVLSPRARGRAVPVRLPAVRQLAQEDARRDDGRGPFPRPGFRLR
jgi:hypothetical protein